MQRLRDGPRYGLPGLGLGGGSGPIDPDTGLPPTRSDKEWSKLLEQERNNSNVFKQDRDRLQNELATANNRIKDLEKQNAQSVGAVSQKDSQITKLTDDLASKTNELEEMKKSRDYINGVRENTEKLLDSANTRNRKLQKFADNVPDTNVISITWGTSEPSDYLGTDAIRNII